MKASPKKEFSVATGHSGSIVSVTIKDTGEPLISEEGQVRQEGGVSSDASTGSDGTDPELFDVIALLRDCGARVQLQREGDVNSITIEIPVAGGLRARG